MSIASRQPRGMELEAAKNVGWNDQITYLLPYSFETGWEKWACTTLSNSTISDVGRNGVEYSDVGGGRAIQ